MLERHSAFAPSWAEQTEIELSKHAQTDRSVAEEKVVRMTKAGKLAPQMEDIRVLVVDDHPVVRRGLHSMLDGESGIRVIGLAASGK